MSETPDDPGAAPNALNIRGGMSLARRRLLRGGLGAAPVLMVSAPRSVMAGVSCNTASALATSFAPSGLVANVPQCSGRLPGYWSSCSLTVWPGTCLVSSSQTKKFDDIFGSTNGYGSSKRLVDVLAQSEAIPKDKLAKYIVAALLNVRKTLTPPVVMSEATVRAIWDACRGGGYYTPTAGIMWYADYSVPASSGGCVAWLKSTMS